MVFETIILAKEDGVAIVTLNRPEVMNAINTQMRDDLREVLDEIRRDRDVRVVVIKGSGEKAFCSGRDLKEYSEAVPDPIEDWANRTERGAGFGLNRLPQPVIAAVNGYALAGGMELALNCDLRIASDTATFGLFEIRRGFFPGGGATWRLAPLVGKGWAMELILGGDPITAQVAERIGLVNRIVPGEKLMEEAMMLARKMASKSSNALMLAKAAINQSVDAYEQTGSNIGIALRSLMEAGEDIREGSRAFMEKRER